MRISFALAIGALMALAACSAPSGGVGDQASVPGARPVQLASAAPDALAATETVPAKHRDLYCEAYPFMCKTVPVQIASAAPGLPLTGDARPPGVPNDPYCDAYPFLYGYGFYQGGYCGPNPYYFGYGGVLYIDVLRFTSQHLLAGLNHFPNVTVKIPATMAMVPQRMIRR
jgi:hypothetical protein